MIQTLLSWSLFIPFESMRGDCLFFRRSCVAGAMKLLHNHYIKLLKSCRMTSQCPPIVKNLVSISGFLEFIFGIKKRISPFLKLIFFDKCIELKSKFWISLFSVGSRVVIIKSSPWPSTTTTIATHSTDRRNQVNHHFQFSFLSAGSCRFTATPLHLPYFQFQICSLFDEFQILDRFDSIHAFCFTHLTVLLFLHLDHCVLLLLLLLLISTSSSYRCVNRCLGYFDLHVKR